VKSPLVLAATLSLAVIAAPVTLQAAPITQPVVKVTGIKVNNVVATASGLVANATMTLNVVGRTITQNVQIPLKLAATAAEPCDILNLSLGPINLDLLGLIVNLDDCEGGPVTVDITGDPSKGLLGALLCDIAGLLDNLNAAQLAVLTAGLTDLLNRLFDNIFNTALPAAAAANHGGGQGNGGGQGGGQGNGGGQGGGGQGGLCPILNLEIDELTLNLLGLKVETSAICLTIDAQRGQGNLLGNLLCGLTGLLDNNLPINANAVQAHVNSILRLLGKLGL